MEIVEKRLIVRCWNLDPIETLQHSNDLAIIIRMIKNFYK